MSWKQKILCGIVCVLFLAVPRLYGQSVTGSVSGIVADATGAIVPGATVTLTNQQTKESRNVTSTGSGTFTFNQILPAIYTVRVEARGFKAYVQQNIAVSTSENVDLHQIKLSVGEVSVVVEVKTDEARVETETGERTGLVTPTQIDTTPNSGLNYMSELRTLPGVAEGSGGGRPSIAGGRAGQAQVQLDGISFQDNGTQGTGGTYNPNLEAIGEIKVMLSNFSAQYGTRAGGAINLAVKSGTNTLHGSAYTYLRNEDMDARNYFSSVRQRDRYINYGYTIGGPIFIPKVAYLKNRDKLFFFFAQEWIPNSSVSNPSFMRVPTVAERNGDFSADIASGAFAGGKPIDITCPGGAAMVNGLASNCAGYSINQAMQYYMNTVLPLPNNCVNATAGQCTSNRANDSYITSSKVVNNQETLRLDWAPAARWTTYLRAVRNYSDSETFPDSTQTFCGTVVGCVGTKAGSWPYIPTYRLSPSYGLVATVIHTFTPNLVDDFTVGFNINVQNFAATAAQMNAITRTSLGMTGANALPQYLPQVDDNNVAPYTVYKDSNFGTAPSFNGTDLRYPFRGRQEALNYTDNLSWVHGAHSFKAGIYIENGRRFSRNYAYFNGDFSFANDNTDPQNTNFSYANAILGIVTTNGNLAGYQQASRRADNHGLYQDIHWYFQDDWKITKRLTLNPGIRFQHSSPTRNDGTYLDDFDPSQYTTVGLNPFIPASGVNPVTGQFVGAAYAGDYAPNADGTYPGVTFPGMVASPLSQPVQYQPPIGIGPRMGFAYDVLGNGKLALRGGIGMFYDRTGPDDNVDAMATQPPHFYTYTASDTTLSDLQAHCCASSNLYLGPQTLTAFQRRFSLPQTYSWSVGVQYDLGHGFLLDEAYQGNVARQLLMAQNINAVNYGTTFPSNPNYNPNSANGSTGNLTSWTIRPYAGQGVINYFTYDGVSNYHSLQSRLTRRFSSRFTMAATWTYSKVQGTGILGNGHWSALAGAPYLPRRRNYGPLTTDHRHIVTLNWTYALPDFRQNNLVAREVLGGWSINGLATMQSGSPTSISMSIAGNSNPTGAIAGDGLAVAPNYNPSAKQTLTGRKVSHLVPARFTIPDVSQSNPTPGLGNAPIGDQFIGAGLDDWDISVFKTFALGEHKDRGFEIRAEAYNAFNHTQFSTVNASANFDPSGALRNKSFGLYTAANKARTMQVAAKFKF